MSKWYYIKYVINEAFFKIQYHHMILSMYLQHIY